MRELKKIRQRTKLNQTDFANKIGFSQSYVSKVEAGKILPCYELLAVLRRVFRLNINKMMDDEV